MENLSSTLNFAFDIFGGLFNALYGIVEPLVNIADGASDLIGMFV
ncbi:hypothetical protein [Corynebacterium sp. MSK150]|nr:MULTISPECIES: hypothetical protein [unclassified Corynebacterium]MDK8524506.1 hypothetical protein [Corynebacterium sp. MSK150]